jgi:hypothetical protein
MHAAKANWLITLLLQPYSIESYGWQLICWMESS